jgi:xylulokinase
MTELLLGIVIGTASSKGVLVTLDGEVVATATRRYEMSMPRPGHAEMDAETVWWGDAVSICGELAQDTRDGQSAAMCVSGLGPCLVLTDEAFTPLRPAILYGMDSRATVEIKG